MWGQEMSLRTLCQRLRGTKLRERQSLWALRDSPRCRPLRHLFDNGTVTYRLEHGTSYLITLNIRCQHWTEEHIWLRPAHSPSHS